MKIDYEMPVDKAHWLIGPDISRPPCGNPPMLMRAHTLSVQCSPTLKVQVITSSISISISHLTHLPAYPHTHLLQNI